MKNSRLCSGVFVHRLTSFVSRIHCLSAARSCFDFWCCLHFLSSISITIFSEISITSFFFCKGHYILHHLTVATWFMFLLFMLYFIVGFHLKMFSGGLLFSVVMYYLQHFNNNKKITTGIFPELKYFCVKWDQETEKFS